MHFIDWWRKQDMVCDGETMMVGKLAFDAATKITAKRCKDIAQQRYLSENQAVEIDAQISKEFKV